MTELAVRRLTGFSLDDPDGLLTREWLVTNGLGGYASGTVAGVNTRRFHGLLIAALPTPYGRRMMLNDLIEQVCLKDGNCYRLGGEERVNNPLDIHGAKYLKEFRLEGGLPVWVYSVPGATFEKRLVIPHGQNTVHVIYRLLEGSELRLELRPAMHFRPHEGPVGVSLDGPYVTTVEEDRYEFANHPNLPKLRMMIHGDQAAFTFQRKIQQHILYRVEESRGYENHGDLWSPGYFHAELAPGCPAALVASTEPWERIQALSPSESERFESERLERILECAAPAAREGIGAELVVAADQFLITPLGRVEDVARAQAAGDEVRTVIAGYHWFTDWGRDTMISLEGLTLCTGRLQEAGWILRTFAYYIRDGLIPNLFPEGEKDGLYHTADATLWFFHALGRYVARSGDRTTLRLLIPKLLDIVQHHLEGTRFGIHVDPADGLLHQGAEGYQLTWMDAKVDDWVVTPRRGKAVEINALWYNALRLLEAWLHEEGDGSRAEEIGRHAEQARTSFNHRFWNESLGYLFDVVDGPNGNDPACRPNQVFAISLDHPVLDAAFWNPVMEVVTNRLLTPVGLRSLAPGEPDFKPKYYGDLRARDAAYHQGTVWSWLIGPYMDAWLKLHPGDLQGGRKLLEGFGPHLGEACIGSISEILDAEPPYTPRGCIVQAWGVAEVLRSWVKTGS